MQVISGVPPGALISAQEIIVTLYLRTENDKCSQVSQVDHTVVVRMTDATKAQGKQREYIITIQV